MVLSGVVFLGFDTEVQMNPLTFLKRILSRPEPPGSVPEYKYEPKGVEDYSGHTKLLARRLECSCEEALARQDSEDRRSVDLDVFDRRIALDRTRDELKKVLMLEVAHTVDRVFEEFLSKKYRSY